MNRRLHCPNSPQVRHPNLLAFDSKLLTERLHLQLIHIRCQLVRQFTHNSGVCPVTLTVRYGHISRGCAGRDCGSNGGCSPGPASNC